jgi:hypothetical protein
LVWIAGLLVSAVIAEPVAAATNFALKGSMMSCVSSRACLYAAAARWKVYSKIPRSGESQGAEQAVS